MLVFINEQIDDPNSLSWQVTGWVAGQEDVVATMLCNGRQVACHRLEQPALRAVLPQFAVSYGIFCRLNLADVVKKSAFSPEQTLEVSLRAGGDEMTRLFEIPPSVTAALREQTAIQQESQDWVTPRLRCTACRTAAGKLAAQGGCLCCKNCGAVYPQGQTGGIEMRDAALVAALGSLGAINVSSNPYEQSAGQLIERVVRQGGWVLDCGAGSRPARTRHVVNLEIMDYASTDVLSAGECLPFADDSFDAAVSLAVLEHVKDPFACARELLRVVKPGGEIVCSVPFLQPLHGYPSHYYNMTREGLKQLFADGEVIDCFTPANGHPILTLSWFLNEYLQGLPAGPRAAFGAMTLAEAAAINFPECLDQTYVAALSQQVQETIACLNTVIVKKI